MKGRVRRRCCHAWVIGAALIACGDEAAVTDTTGSPTSDGTGTGGPLTTGSADSGGTASDGGSGGSSGLGDSGSSGDPPPDPPVDGDPCLALDLTFSKADCEDPSVCAPVQCDCGDRVESFGACEDTECVAALDCDVLCLLTAQQIDNCVERVYRLANCANDDSCSNGPCTEYFGQQVCVQQLPCIDDVQCEFHCADGSCTEAAPAPCLTHDECDWACDAGLCTHGAAGATCEDSPQCEANFCVDGLCSTGSVGEGCFADANCTTDSCTDNLCTGLAAGETCDGFDERCVSELCVGGVCTTGHRGAPCDSTSDCYGPCDEPSMTCL